MSKQIVFLSVGIFGCIISLSLATKPAGAQAVLSANPGDAAVSPEARVKIGRGEDYVPSTTDPEVLFDKLRASMNDRRVFGWQVVERVLKPKKIKLLDEVTEVEVPLWQTWYEGSGENTEVRDLIKLYLTNLKPVLDADPDADVKPVVAATMKQFSTKDLSSSLTDANFSSVLLQFEGAKISDLLGRGSTIFSPSFVEHVLEEARGIDECKFDITAANQPGPSPDQFSPCMKEFPRDAVMVKTSWEELNNGIPIHDTSKEAMSALIQEGTWPGLGHPSKEPPIGHPGRSQIYTNITVDGTEWALKGIHFVTKDVREWVWVSLWWDPNASTDFGADRPASIDNFNGGVWKNYKMCVVSSFAEKDPAPWSQFTGSQQSLGDSIKAVFDAIQADNTRGAKTHVGDLAIWLRSVPNPLHLAGALGPWPAPYNEPTCWCSNPNIERHPANARTSCIGCHQIAFTKNEARNREAQFSDVMVGDIPQFGKVRARKNFPAEFSWAFSFEFKPDIASGKPAGFSWPSQ